MSDYTNPPPRRPLVPGPSGIAAKAIAVREQKAAPSSKPLPDYAQALRDKALHDAYPAYVVPGPVGNLAKGISGVMSEVGTIAKSGFNAHHNYKYATLQDLLHALTPLMGKHGVCIIQNEVDRSTVETKVMVTYEFSIFHTSGEVWPERPRFTGMSLGQTRGGFDDKAINKCHSAARKYFLLSLFQVPSGDFDDADAGPAQTKVTPQSAEPTRRNVPGPPSKPTETVEADSPGSITPQKIGLGQGAGALSWANKYIEVVKTANELELAQWDELNAGILQKLHEEHYDLYRQIEKAVTQRTLEIAPLLAMPDPEIDTQEAMQWVAQQLADATTYEEAETLWNIAIAPHEAKFDPADWELLMNEWRRMELRLSPESEDDGDA